MGLTTLFIGQQVINLVKVNSTNAYLHDLVAKKEYPEGLIVCAVEQYAGKGQRDALWVSSPGANLTFSILLKPGFLPFAEQFKLTQALSLGVAEFVSQTAASAEVKVKWPNDIYANKRKIAGILVENIVEASSIKYTIVGIGVNINQVDFSPALPNATSLSLLSDKKFDLTKCLEELCVCIEKFYLELRHSDYGHTDVLYHKLLYKKDKSSRFSLNGKIFDGIIKGVTARGHLLISAENDIKTNSDNIIEVRDIKQLAFL